MGSVFFKTECLEEHCKDTLAVHHEHTLQPTPPEALYARVPIAAPTLGEVVQTSDAEAGHYKVTDYRHYDAMQEFR